MCLKDLVKFIFRLQICSVFFCYLDTMYAVIKASHKTFSCLLEPNIILVKYWPP